MPAAKKKQQLQKHDENFLKFEFDLLNLIVGSKVAVNSSHNEILKKASGVQDITCVFVEVAGSYEKNFNLTVSWDGV